MKEVLERLFDFELHEKRVHESGGDGTPDVAAAVPLLLTCQQQQSHESSRRLFFLSCMHL